MDNRNIKFPKSSLIVAILCVIAIAAFIVFYSKGDTDAKYFLAVIAVWVLLMPIFIVEAIANIRHCLRYFKLKKVAQLGTDGVCRIVDYRIVKYNNKRWNKRFALIVKYIDNGIEKKYKTGYDYVAEEYRYLKSLQEIKCKYKGRLLFITEKIPDEIYENLTVIGKVKSKFLRTFLVIWQIIGAVGAALLLVGIFATLMTDSNLYLIIGVLCLFIPNLICGLIFAVHFLITLGHY